MEAKRWVLEEGGTYHGEFTWNRDCTVMKYVNMPISVAPAAIMTTSQRFSCASGQTYLRFRSRMRTNVSLAILWMERRGRRGRIFGLLRGDGALEVLRQLDPRFQKPMREVF